MHNADLHTSDNYSYTHPYVHTKGLQQRAHTVEGTCEYPSEALNRRNGTFYGFTHLHMKMKV